jgi:N-acetylneuraminic acid mutarotase
VWRALPNKGLDLRVRAFALIGKDLFVGGKFTRTADATETDLGGIARYDTLAGTWNPLPNKGLDGEVMALAMSGKDLYVGGGFTQTSDGAIRNLGYIAQFDTDAGRWTALPNQGLDGEIYALAVVGGNVYAGGRFTQTNDGLLTKLGGIARYNPVAGTWHALPNQGLNGHVYALEASGRDLYVGGGFVQTADGALRDLNHVVRYDTAARTWNALPHQGLNGSVSALTVSGSGLYAGGLFTETADGAVGGLGNIARLDTMAGVWNALPNRGLDNQVRALAVVDADVYVGGTFAQTGDGSAASLGRIIRYDTVANRWTALPRQGLSDWVYALLAVEGHLYVGGSFHRTGDGTVVGLNRIARLGLGQHMLYLPLVTRG